MIHALQPGEQLDYYGLEALVAHTGMASIFRGTDLNTRLTVAVKIPDPNRSPWFNFGFALSCALGSIYGSPQGAWPFGLVAKRSGRSWQSGVGG